MHVKIFKTAAFIQSVNSVHAHSSAICTAKHCIYLALYMDYDLPLIVESVPSKQELSQ